MLKIQGMHLWWCTNKVGPGRVVQSVTCLATYACLTADPGVASSIPVRSHTFVEIDHEMISTVILPLPLIHSRMVVVSYKQKCVHELLVNRLFKPALEKVWLGEPRLGMSVTTQGGSGRQYVTGSRRNISKYRFVLLNVYRFRET